LSTTNREVFVLDPTEGDIPNLGVAKVKNPEDDGDWRTLEWELRSFVCEGEYEKGLERILDQFLSHLSQSEQPAAWVSGFFGSGKSHLMRVLEYLWRDYSLPSGASARDLATLPADIEAHLFELSSAGKRVGGLWSAAGTLGSGASGSVRLAFLAIVFDAAGLPQHYAPARLALWLKSEGLFEKVGKSIEEAGKSVDNELRNLYVSPVLAQSLIDSGATFGETPAAVSKALQTQFPSPDDIGNDEMLDVFEQVLQSQSSRDGKLPLTLVVLDEMQQYINDDNARALNVQDLVEGCSSRFGSQVLVVATGQSALTANPTLQKLIDRFSVTVALSDTDVETVVRKVVLRKKPDTMAQIDSALEDVSGEIDRHLGGTKLAAVSADKATLVSDYPLLPTRRRFWERALRAIDKAGKAGVLRTQLKIVHEAARSVADRPLGTVIGADFVFRSESASMLQSGVLLKEIDELIRGFATEDPVDGELKSRCCALVFLITQLPCEGVRDTGLRATAPMIADLLVEDLAKDGPGLRKDVPRVLDELADQGRLVKLNDEYRLQTEEGAEWTKDYNQNRVAVSANAARMSTLRTDWLLRTVAKELAGLKLSHGESKTPRKVELSWGEDEPSAVGSAIQVWIRDEWGVTESKVKESAAQAGAESPTIFVLLPTLEAEHIRDTLASMEAASDAMAQRPEPQTDEGRQAKQGMLSRVTAGEQRLTDLFESVVSKARIFQGGGNELTSSSFRSGVEKAADNALSRQFPKFLAADNPNWDKVMKQARDGAADALSAVAWSGEVPANPICKEVLGRTAGSGTKGSELHNQLGDPPYGWPPDAINGALLALLSNGNIRAERDGKPINGAKELPATQIKKAVFYKEDEPPTTNERMAVRGVLTEAKIAYESGQEAASISGLLQKLLDLATRCGGPAPLPASPDTSHIDGLQALAGNQQFREIAKQSEQLRQGIGAWTATAKERDDREERWRRLERLLDHARTLADADEIRTQRDAIMADRLLLAAPDPVQPLITQICQILRDAVNQVVSEVALAHKEALDELESSDEWPQLADADRDALLKQSGLTQEAAPALGSDSEILAALDSVSLPTWKERRLAVAPKAKTARSAAAKLLEPASVDFKSPKATLKTEADVEAYVTDLREELLVHIEADETVII